MANINYWTENPKKNSKQRVPNCRIHYWICKKKEKGLVPTILTALRKWRFALLKEIKEMQKAGTSTKEIENTIQYVLQFVIKIIMNSCLVA